ncbi:phosphoribosylanthranilate isomerase [Mesonia sp. MT50]|uniref:N-(5'-phosphoribosyl)anthranilate isomerase n=1 Tax=Mesonia profundi TaxID=3070998 RepID=A0ABU1A190_9FLAO|nr:phosphoribosylanthranilate isomerase [Mesonia profundi]MDQ7917463.1 phosphoribosylanthranilate isomerase [Mesonia profundi]
MKHPDNIKKVSALSPDYIGFIFYKKSPRYLTQIPENIPEGIKKTGVFVNEEYDQILDKVRLFNLQAVQLHGEESVELCEKLRHQNLEVIKAFSIDDDFNFEKIHSYQKVTDYFLFDTKGKNYGGNGLAFNWSILQNYRFSHPFFLSGGIGLEHSEEIKKINDSSLPLVGIDLNSKFEIAPGLKDIQKLKKMKESLL